MFEMLAVFFLVILGFTVFAAIKYGFNIIFIYILLFSLIVVVWAIAAIVTGKRDNDRD